MKIYSLIVYDFKQGSRLNRFLLLLLIALLQCMLVEIDLNFKAEYLRSIGQTSEIGLLSMILGIFAGCPPIYKSSGWSFPYAWFALMLCPVFITFDHLHTDLINTGIQLITRVQKRRSWWISKCIWNTATVFIAYCCVIITILLYCIITGIPLSETDSSIKLATVFQEPCYNSSGIQSLSSEQVFFLLLCPLLSTTALSMLQMILSLLMKPLFSFAVTVILLLGGITFDQTVFFTRTSMICFNTFFYSDGYSIMSGLCICFLIILASALIGFAIFKCYDIMPERNETL